MRPSTVFHKLAVAIVSIHASVKDATKSFFAMPPGDGFNPRICKRCDSLDWVELLLFFCFNPRICKRCDLAETKNIKADTSFQSTHL